MQLYFSTFIQYDSERDPRPRMRLSSSQCSSQHLNDRTRCGGTLDLRMLVQKYLKARSVSPSKHMKYVREVVFNFRLSAIAKTFWNIRN